jgi:aryl-alcohol dehydrogenase-like predicted oxidoreductase
LISRNQDVRSSRYQAGTSEEVVGRAIERYARREDIVLATKVHGKDARRAGRIGTVVPQGDPGTDRGLLDPARHRLRDLYPIHRFDPDTPVEETMEALHQMVKAGKVRYLSASSMFAWQM